jgi:hypothetical protein
MATTPEGKVKDAVKKILRDNNIWFYMPVQTGYGVAGIPDFVCCVPPTGHFLAIETKAPGKRNQLRPTQVKQIEAIQTARGWALVVDDPQQLAEFLETIGHEGLSTA